MSREFAVLQLTMKLFEASRKLPPPAFRVAVLKSLRQYIPFDKAMWLRLSPEGGITSANGIDICLDSLIRDYVDIVKDDDPFASSMANQLGKTVDSEVVLPYDEVERLDVHKDFYRKHGLLIGLGLSFEERTDYYSSLYLQRSSLNFFTPMEVRTLDELYRVVREAHLANLEFFLLRRHLFASAVVDRNAAILLSTEQFDDVLLLEAEDFRRHLSKKLDLSRVLNEGSEASEIYDGERITLTAHVMFGEIVLQAFEKDPYVALSEGERRVAVLLKTGMSYKEAAAKLNLSPKTVRNRMSIISEKLHLPFGRGARAL